MVPGGHVGSYALTPDGLRVLYIADPLVDGRDELFMSTLVPPFRER